MDDMPAASIRVAGRPAGVVREAPPDDRPRCLDCGERFELGTGYGDHQLFCSEVCADSFRRELGA